MHRISTLVLALTVSVLLLIVGCSSSTPATAPLAGKLAPDFQLSDLEGQIVSLGDFQGKPVLLNFWATWCGPCRHEMPFIQKIFEEWEGKGLVILAIDIGEPLLTVGDFIQSNKFSFPVLLDANKDVALEYNIRGIPTSFFIDKDGIIQVIKVGPFSGTAEIEKSLSIIIP